MIHFLKLSMVKRDGLSDRLVINFFLHELVRESLDHRGALGVRVVAGFGVFNTNVLVF